MKKFILLLLIFISTLAFADGIHFIDLGGEGEANLFFNDKELYLVLPYVGEYAKLDRSMLAVDKDGFLKLTYKNKKLLIIDGEYLRQDFSEFQHDGENKYDEYENEDFYSFNIKNITATSSYSEIIKGRKINYTPDNLYKCFYQGCKCHPYWWNDSHIPWVEGAKGNGIGESITVEYKNPVTGISILNGYTDINNMKLFKENSRLKEISIKDWDSGKTYNVKFEDKVYFNYIHFDSSTKKITITIKDVYKGTKYTDTCVSAIVEHTYEKDLNYYDKYFDDLTTGLVLENQDIVLQDYFFGKSLFSNKYVKEGQ